MIITNLNTQKKNENRFNLEVDGKFACSLSTSTIALYNIYKGKVIEEKILDEIISKEVENRFFDRAVNVISASLKTKKQIKIYLSQLSFKKKDKWFNESLNISPIILNVVERLEKYGFLNDRNYAQLFVESRIKNKPRGARVLIMELISKGIDSKLAKEIVSNLVVNDIDLIKRTFEKRFKNQKLDLENKKMIDFLRRKGFDWDDISKLGREIKGENYQ